MSSTVTNKRRIVVQEHDTLPEIFSKVEHFNDAVVTIETDGNEMIGNYLSLKILLAKFSDRKFQIVTNNKVLRKIAEGLGIRTFSKNDDLEFEQVYAEKNLLKHNFTFFEYLSYQLRKMFSKIAFRFERRRNVYKNKKTVRDSNVFLLVGGLVLSISLLAFIFYFAVSRTYVYITPELAVKTTSRNLVFTEKKEATILDTKNVIQVKRLEQSVDMDYAFNVATFDTGSARNAHGKVTFFNELPNEQVFRPNTRLSTLDGIIYRTTDWLRIPPTRTLSGSTVIGQIDAVLVADVYDNKGDVIGVRGNLPAETLLSIPGLKFNRDKVYGKMKEDFRDGQNPTVKILTQSELDKFKNIIIDKLKMKAMDTLNQRIKDSNLETGASYDILPIQNKITYSEPVVSTATGVVVGARISDVTLYGNIRISAYLYDRGAAVGYLAGILKENLLYGTEKLHAINEDSLRVTNILFQSEPGVPFGMKATCELDASISYNFEDPSNNLTKKLKNLIVNSTEEEATSILLNDSSNIANVKLRFSPFWMTRVSSNPDSIEFIIEK